MGATGRILLAVSGGPDSTALLAAAAAVGDVASIQVATVDHGLRPDAVEEARAVAALSSRYGLPHRILLWDGEKPAQGLQAAARKARYERLTAFAVTIDAHIVMTAHTRDDQAETVLMRLLAGSGPAGLAGMRAQSVLIGGLRLIRPFLAIPKIDLVAYCEARGLDFARDPSNQDDRFTRARLRRLMPSLAGEGLSTARLCRLAERCARETAALDDAAEAAFRAARRPAKEGCVRLDGAALCHLPEAIVLRVVNLGLQEVDPHGADRLERLERVVLGAVLPALRAKTALRRTLRAALVAVTADGDVAVTRAPPRRSRSGTDL